MNEHWKGIIENAPLAGVGMVIGTMDGWLQALPYTVKVMSVVIPVFFASIAVIVTSLTMFSDLKADVRVLIAHQANCAEIHMRMDHRMDRIESKVDVKH